MTPCPCGSTEVTRYPHRPEGEKKKDKTICFNGIAKVDHVCVTECSYLGQFCARCRLVRNTGIRLYAGIEIGR